MVLFTDKTSTKVAAVQAAPVYMDLEASIEKAAGLIKQAADQDCELINFGEAWFPGYPFYIWLGPPAWGFQFVSRYMDNSLDLKSESFARLQQCAKDNDIMVGAGYSERDGASLYLGQCLIDRDGEVIFTRRKLKPTHVERAVYGEGYGKDLLVTDTRIGNVGALCCWEHIQPLNKYAMYGQQEHIHLAGWPAFSVYPGKAHALGQEVNMSASQVYAVEGSCFVVAASSVVDQATLDILKVGEEVPPFVELGGGSAMIFGPDGRRLAEHIPPTQEGLIIADLNYEEVKLAKSVADPTGHYSKPESTRLIHNKNEFKAVDVRSTLNPVALEEDNSAETLAQEESA